MIGMNFISFIILLAISIVISGILHYVLKFYARPGIVSFIAKVIYGWIGAWLGSPVFGNWFGGVVYENIYIIPAIIGSLALLTILVDLALTIKGASAEKPEAVK